MRHCGVHWPENAGGEHPTRDAILAIPGMQGAVTICSPSARYHYDAILQHCRAATLVWRAVPRSENPDRRPAKLGWEPNKVADECLNLWDEQPHGGIEWFLPLNELQFERENGAPFPGYAAMAENLARLRLQLRRKFAQKYPESTVRLMFPAWVPQDDIERPDEWRSEAEQWDAVAVHCYGSAETMRARYQSYRAAFPGKPLFVGEWNSNHEGHDERASLAMWAEISDTDPAFLGATYYIWETNNEGERDLSIWGNPERLALFRDPPTISLPAPVPAPEAPAMPERDPYEFFTAIEIANAAALAVSDVRANWPKLHAQLVLCGIADRPVQIGMIGTAAVESGMRPIHEYGTEADWAGYEGGAAYAGRGFIQRTHRRGYELAGRKIAELWQTDPNQPDFDLVTNPDNLLNPDLAAADAAIFFRDTKTVQGYGIVDACRAQDWEWVRRLVLGGPDPAGTARIARVAAALGGPSVPVAPPDTARVTYNANEPAHPQEDSFDCSQESLEWALFSLGRHPSDDWLENTMIAEGVMSPEQGLLDATGKGLAEFVTRQYQAETGIYANHEPSVSFDFVALEGGHAYPLLLGGRAWGHWSGCSGYDAARDLLLLANPSSGWQGVEQTMNRAQFDALGPFSLVRVLHPDLLDAAPVPAPQPEPAPEPQPAPTPEPVPSRARVLVSEIKDRLDELARLVA